jgi:mannose-6-phosphate isomerase-like protein (cupin superfamily)
MSGGTRMAMKGFVGVLAALMLASAANAQDSPFRKELNRADLTGTNMEVITSINEIKPGEASTLHIHHGEESYYFIEGGMIETPDGKQASVPTGATGINRRDVPHGAFKVVGDKPVKYLSVHIVDKGKPLYDKPN